MPRVSEEYLERRRQQIVEAARRCFIRKGVHATSMQDIFAESGLSAGAVYRYFKSKNELIEAITGQVISDLHVYLEELVTHEPLLPLDEVVVRMTRRIQARSAEDGFVRLAPQAWALAMYEPELRVYVQDNLTRLRGHWITYARRCAENGLLAPGADAECTGKALFGLLPGFLIQCLITEDAEPEEIAAGVRALTRAALIDPAVPTGT
ncbi:TetR/AcrR family transcriptional regulator [Actinomadura sp. SCN-SB]|uniref:TetR/AcrR family transcriptional regulator n=1 Tax=Actinomadura sp. SCN-SB TaxID=3373092 RepID=UPI00375328C6